MDGVNKKMKTKKKITKRFGKSCRNINQATLESVKKLHGDDNTYKGSLDVEVGGGMRSIILRGEKACSLTTTNQIIYLRLVARA